MDLLAIIPWIGLAIAIYYLYQMSENLDRQVRPRSPLDIFLCYLYPKKYFTEAGLKHRRRFFLVLLIYFLMVPVALYYQGVF